MNKWKTIKETGNKLSYAENEEFEAIVRYKNASDSDCDQKVYLTMGDGFIWMNGSKLSLDWDIVLHRPKRKLKK